HPETAREPALYERLLSRSSLPLSPDGSGLGSTSGCLSKRNAECLEDRLEDMFCVAPFDQPNVQRQAGSDCKLTKEVRDEIRAETSDPRVRQIDVGDNEGPA